MHELFSSRLCLECNPRSIFHWNDQLEQKRNAEYDVIGPEVKFTTLFKSTNLACRLMHVYLFETDNKEMQLFQK